MIFGADHLGRQPLRSSHRTTQTSTVQAPEFGVRLARGCRLALLHDVDDWEARIGVEARGGEERGADVSVEERVAAAAVRGGDPLRLGECVDGELAGPLEPAFVAGACERLEEREAVTRSAVAEAVALLVPVRARTPDELGAGEQKVLVEILPSTGDDTRRAGAPLRQIRPSRGRASCERGEPGQFARPSSQNACRVRTAALSLATAASASKRSRASVFPATPCSVLKPR